MQGTLKIFLLLSLGFPLQAAPLEKVENDAELEREKITIIGQRLKRLRGRDASSRTATERLSADALTRYGAHSLADGIGQASGVNTQTFCANCGAKRVTIDGLRGEHTTILIDGVPLHSTVSAFYGVDAIPVVGISAVEVNRGAGSALLSPEAIGGSINLVTLNPLETGIRAYTEASNHGSSLSTVLATAKSENSAVMLSGQSGSLQPWDLDHNEVGEFPYRKTQAFSLKLTQRIGETTELVLRRSESDLLIVGGNTKRLRPNSYTRIQAQPSDFVDNDVTKEYIGDLERISDVVELKRHELAAELSQSISPDTLAHLRISRVDQFQNANYSHGYDYNNQDRIDYINIDVQKAFDSHLITLAADHRRQKMRSTSQALYIERQNPLTPDSLNFRSTGFGLLDEWSLTDRLGLDIALRVDRIEIHWTELDRKIVEEVVAPRFNLKYDHTDHISSRLSYGLGYRPPLTLFESEHGANHDGFLVEISDIEKADSYVYSLSANYPTWFITGTYHHTELRNMAYAFDRVPKGQPIVFLNSPESYSLGAADLFLGGKIGERINLQAGYELFFYPRAYQRKLPAAALEKRLVAEADVELESWEFGFQASWVGARNLAHYGYDEHYRVYDLDVTSPSFGQVSQQKSQKSPAFWHANVQLKAKLSANYALAFRINNILDYTQTGAGDSPATWHYHLNHAHYDNFHTWGPLSGREYFAGIEGRW